MKSNEVRIGNYTQCYIYGELQNKEHVVDAHDFSVMQSSKWYDLRPIPLTEDWLLKFGFNFAHSTWYVKSTYLGDISSLEYINFCIQQKKVTIDDGYDEMTLCNINYVHQLQNLYFALTGEELIINENL